MSTLNTHRVQLPDGTCVRIEGGDAESTAHFLFNHYLEQGITTSMPAAEPPLVMPATHFAPPPGFESRAAAQPKVNFYSGMAPVMDNQNSVEEEPLVMPTINWKEKSPPAEGAAAPVTELATNGEQEPLPLPVWPFSRK